MMKMLPGEKTLSPHKAAGWRGYNYEELLYRRAYVTARIELERDELLYGLKTQQRSITGSGLTGVLSMLGGVFKYANWGILAFQTFKTIGSLFARKKR